MSEQNNTGNNKRIAKNTLLLYFRMLFLMLVSLYTSRVILSSLGIEDFGIYNVVGGVVSMFTILSGSLSAAICRFITFELGTGNKERLIKVFSTSINIQLILIALIVLLLESIGLWFLNYKMVISSDRIFAANWVFQFSIITFSINLLSIPYNAAIIAHEKMVAFAYISIFDAICKLVIAFAIAYNPIDRLIYYALLIMIISVIDRLLYGIYCKKHFGETKYKFILDKSLLREMFGFAGWNFIGASAGVLRTQGVNILINLFYGATVNAARGISVQISAAVSGLATNFMTALNPQITKSYASGDLTYMNQLILRGTKFSFYLLLLLSLPIIVEAHTILSLWLKNVPTYSVSFVQLVLIFALIEAISGPMMTAMLATGNIKRYQILVGGTNLLNLPISYILLKSFGFESFPEITFVVVIILSIACLIERVFLLKDMVNLNIKEFVRLLMQMLVTTFSAAFIPVSLHLLWGNNFACCLTNIIVSLLGTLVAIAFIGCSKQERKTAIVKLKNIYRSKIKHE